ncbi:MAG: hypothetical protein JNJ73_15170 [Hyphomonadaceae bacterium]|nr:hypothetical protein [Hyphomonadaceae bacterium]
MSSRRRGREKRRKLDPIEAAFAQATGAAARRDLAGALAWAKVARALEEAEKRCGLHRRAEERLAAQHARNMARVAEAQAALARRQAAVDRSQDEVNRLAAELRRMRAQLLRRAAKT